MIGTSKQGKCCLEALIFLGVLANFLTILHLPKHKKEISYT